MNGYTWGNTFMAPGTKLSMLLNMVDVINAQIVTK